jgi:hypothetical protein
MGFEPTTTSLGSVISVESPGNACAASYLELREVVKFCALKTFEVLGQPCRAQAVNGTMRDPNQKAGMWGLGPPFA